MTTRRSPRALFVLAIVSMAAMVQPGGAFCVYNEGTKSKATFLALPLSAHTFKSVLNPGASGCCNWQNPTCFAKEEGDDEIDPLGRCADVLFLVTSRSIDTGALTKKLLDKEVKEIFAPIIGVLGIAASPIPVVGAAISVAAAATAAGLDWSAQQTHLDIDIKPEDKLVHATNGGALSFNPDTGKISASKASGC